MKNGLVITVALLFVLAVVSCHEPRDGQEGAWRIPSELLWHKSSYDTSKTFEELVKPHYAARNIDGELMSPRGEPKEIVEIDGQIKVKIQDERQFLYLDLLAIESEIIGEHPVQKVFRLEAMGVSVSPKLKRKLDPTRFFYQSFHVLFHVVSFEYLPGQKLDGVISEVFPDGTFLVIPLTSPPEWKGAEDAISPPTHFHVDSRAFMGDSLPVREYEKEILALSFDEQRYPPAEIARKQCDLYYASREGEQYRELLASIGWLFDSSYDVPDSAQSLFGERAQRLVWGGGSESFRYFGFEGLWTAEVLRGLGATWLKECDASGVPHQYWALTSSIQPYYASRVESLEPNPKERHKIVKIDGRGGGETIYTAPGAMLLARPLPYPDNYWIMSAEGWPAPEADIPGDPRWQSVYIVNIKNPDEYYVVEYPLAEYEKKPRGGHLYGSSGLLRSDGKTLYVMLYGFTDEGGGLWAVDLSKENFYTNLDAFSRIFGWDHGLSWMVIGVQGGTWSVFLTGKEVADNFAMTANYIRIKENGLSSTMEYKERLVRMVGWNPVPFATQTVGQDAYLVLVETYYNYESSLFPRATGVYIVPVDTSPPKQSEK